jgi:hypothetical protein
MRTPLIALAAVAAATLAARPAAAQGSGTIDVPSRNESVTRVATRGAAFLSLGVGARALALAGAFTATASDLSAAYWNPAGLGEVTTASGFASHEKLYGNSGLTNTFVTGVIPAFGGAFGVSFTGFSSGDIERTTEFYPEGGDPALGQTVTWTGTSVGVHYARQFTDRLTAGGTLKRASEGIEFASATWYAADFGVRFRSGIAGSTLGFTVANLGSSARMGGPAIQRRLTQRADPQFPTGRPLDIGLRPQQLQLPTALRFAVQTDILGGAESLMGARYGADHTLALVGDVSDAIDTGIMPAMAAEYGFKHKLFLRGGGRWLNDGRLGQGSGISYSAGGGVVVPVANRRFVLDYAWRNFGALNDNQVISFQFGY